MAATPKARVPAPGPGEAAQGREPGRLSQPSGEAPTCPGPGQVSAASARALACRPARARSSGSRAPSGPAPGSHLGQHVGASGSVVGEEHRWPAKATTIKEALARWEEKSGQKPSEAKEVKLYAQIPPVEKMDASLSMLANCEKLSLSTNCIEKIANLNGLKNLRILSLGRNNIKNLNGLEAVGDTLEELWISYNFIEKLKGIHVMKRLKILYMSNNLVRDWAEFVKLAELACLEELVFVGNPLEEKCSSEGNWIDEATRRVPRLKKLDGIPVIKEEEEEEG
ncbi:dynein axonemal light chain 1 isoform X1 [Macrotis lagotis]|uniref:dynein axonemal light chain 1 isoform X1 n=1 Tax=Macrotis lagotis TaxID=92651 RepID=UPI003D681EB2